MNKTPSITTEFRRLLMPWSFALLLPLPMLVAGSSAQDSDIATLYFALGAAWLASDAFRPGEVPQSLAHWRRRMAVLVIYLVIDAGVFLLFGLSAGVNSNIPLPLLAMLGIAPSFGLVPWLTLNLRQPYAAIVLGCFTVALIKLGACVVARIVYGPDYLTQGYASADWQTAKLMISIMWAGTLLASAVAFIACYKFFARGTRCA